MKHSTTSAANLVEVERNAATGLVNLIHAARTAGDALTVRAAAEALSSLSSYYKRHSDSDERNKMPAVELATLQQALDDRYALASFIAANPALAERQGIALPRWGDTFDSEVDKILYWRSPEQQAIDAKANAEYAAKREAEKAQAEAATN